MSTQATINHYFDKCDTIEVLRNADDDNFPVRFPATIIDSPSPSGTLHVKYSTLFVQRESKRKRKKIKDYVNVSDAVTRPILPPERHRCFVVGEEVEVFCRNAWRRCEVKDVLENSMYTVVVDGTVDVVVPNRDVRVCDQKQDVPHSVEIAHGAGRYLSTWYPVVILGPVRNGKYLVEYRTLKSSNGLKLVEEEVRVLCIRPSPPIFQRAHQFALKDAVDAWDGSGWKIGQICTVMKDFKYEVYFWAIGSVVEFEHAYLRPHQDFIYGAWIGNYKQQMKGLM
ncbi:hypothetical protein SSX86_001760 [Deinandra increscens subsp. villosa]|uniref:Agenet-like domain-containing protein n=1 Tax=Deinandra increscens subsp. villosa TaxID=3103831 RepID=A0AAP0HET1_9ASTR